MSGPEDLGDCADRDADSRRVRSELVAIRAHRQMAGGAA
jgi:hypothetical protein